MDLLMVNVKLHDVIVGDKAHQVRIGQVDNGYFWKCRGFRCEATLPTRQAALEDAHREIKARSLEEDGTHG